MRVRREAAMPWGVGWKRCGVSGLWGGRGGWGACVSTSIPSLYDVLVVVPAFAEPSYELDQEFFIVVIECLWNLDLDGDVVITGMTRSVRYSLAAKPQPLSTGSPRRDFHFGLTVDRSDRRQSWLCVCAQALPSGP